MKIQTKELRATGHVQRDGSRLTFHRSFGRLFLRRKDYFFQFAIQFLADSERSSADYGSGKQQIFSLHFRSNFQI